MQSDKSDKGKLLRKVGRKVMGLKYCHYLLKVGEAISYNVMTAKLPAFLRE